MKRGIAILALTAALAAAASAETINPGFFPDGARGPQMPHATDAGPTAQQLRAAQWRIEVAALRREALALQEQDGGTLSEDHRAMLQAKLDRINARLTASR